MVVLDIANSVELAFPSSSYSSSQLYINCITISDHTKSATADLVNLPGGNKGSGPAIKAKRKEQKDITNKCSCNKYEETQLIVDNWLSIYTNVGRKCNRSIVI